MLYRQGDILLKLVTGTDPASKKQRVKNYVIARGEATGHTHRVVGECVLETVGDRTYLELEKPTEIQHEEHDKLVVPPGIYEILRQREYTLDNIRQVSD